jgi:uncharacterized damage-inducible protein DinB
MSISPQATIAGTLAGARSYLNMVMQDLPEDQFNWLSPGTANTISDYAQAVQTRTEAYLAGLTATELGREVSYMSKPQPVAMVLGALPVHTAFHTGEIAVLKGAQGAKGLPF